MVVWTETDCPGKSVRVVASRGASSAGFVMLLLGEIFMMDSLFVSMTTCFLSWIEMVFLLKSWVIALSLRKVVPAIRGKRDCALPKP